MQAFRHLTIVTLALLFAVGCSSTAGSATVHRSAPTTRTITDRDKGTTVTLHVADHLQLILASTYWTIKPASGRTVLRADGPPVTKAKLQGCVPGGGCGTTAERFTAVKVGTTIVSASRTTCGEALRCTGRNGEYKVSVVVR